DFFINQTRIVGIAFLIYFLLIRYVNIDYKIFAICLLALISGLVTRRIESKFFTYALLAIALVGTSSVGRHDSFLSFARSRIMRSLSMISLAVWVLGLVTLVVLPGTSGYLAFTISREIRGEVTLWYWAGL